MEPPRQIVAASFAIVQENKTGGVKLCRDEDWRRSRRNARPMSPTPPRLRLRRHGGLLVIDMLKALYRQWPVISRCVLERQPPSGCRPVSHSGALVHRAAEHAGSIAFSARDTARHTAHIAALYDRGSGHNRHLHRCLSSWTGKPGRRWDLSRPRPIWPSMRPTAGERRPVRRPGLYMTLAQSRLVCPQIRHQAGLRLHAGGAGSDTGRRHPGGSPGRGVDRLH